MLNLKHGDTDAPITFTFAVAGAAIDLTDSTVAITFLSSAGIRHTADASITAPATDGVATWTPTDDDYAILRPGNYDVEAIITRTSGAERAAPTRGYDKLKIWPRL